jgi:hypothetical protein
VLRLRSQVKTVLHDHLPRIQSRRDAYSRKKAYEELKLLNNLRQQGVLTQEEFDEKKEALLCI